MGTYMTFVLQPLDYSIDSLQPHLSAAVVDKHYNGITKQYFDAANQLLSAREFPDFDNLADAINYASLHVMNTALLHNLCSAWNHQFFWKSISPKLDTQPSTELLKDIIINFDSIDGLKAQFIEAGVNGIGSHWTWLVRSAGRLQIKTTPNSTTPILHDVAHPLLVIDGWEHSYCEQYHTDKRGYYEAVWQLINWEHVNDRFA